MSGPAPILRQRVFCLVLRREATATARQVGGPYVCECGERVEPVVDRRPARRPS